RAGGRRGRIGERRDPALHLVEGGLRAREARPRRAGDRRDAPSGVRQRGGRVAAVRGRPDHSRRGTRTPRGCLMAIAFDEPAPANNGTHATEETGGTAYSNHKAAERDGQIDAVLGRGLP